MERVLTTCVLLLVTAAGCANKPDLPASTQTTPPSRPATATAIQKATNELASQLAAKLPKDKLLCVMPLTDGDGGVRELGFILASSIEHKLLADGFKMADRSLANKVLTEIDFRTAFSKEATMPADSTALKGVDVLIGGMANLSGEEVILSAKAVDLKTRTAASTDLVELSSSGLGPLLRVVNRPAKETGGDLPPLTVQYELATLTDRGEVRLVNGSTVLGGQKFRVRVQANSDCYFYILLYSSQGKAQVLFPHDKIGVPNAIRGGVEYEIPRGKTWYWFDDSPGTETFYIVASYTPLERLDGILADMQKAGDGTREVLVKAAEKEISSVVVRGMKPETSAEYQPKGFKVTTLRGVTVGDAEESPVFARDTQSVDDTVAGYVTVVKKVVVNHQ